MSRNLAVSLKAQIEIITSGFRAFFELSEKPKFKIRASKITKI